MGTGARLLMGVSITTALCDWVKPYRKTLTVCATLHVPSAMRVVQNGGSAQWLSKQLTAYLKNLDRRVLKAASRNHGARIVRWVTLEHSEKVGWHAHIAFETPAEMDQSTFITTADLLWRKHVGQYASQRFNKYLSQVEPVTGNFLFYTIKNVYDQDDFSRGVLDLPNIHLPK